MEWLRKLSQSFIDTQYWGNQFRRNNPEYEPQFEVYQSLDFPHVFLGGEDDFEEAEAKAGQPICKIVDCRDMPEIDESSWDYATFITVQEDFDSKVNDLVQKISTTDCPIFVHCALGANRSVSVLAAALAQLTGKPLNSILSEMKQVRSYVNPQDPYYLMALQQSPSETPQFKQERFDELDQDFPLIQPGLPTNTAQIPENFPDDLLGDMNLLHEEKQWRQAVSTPGSLVSHNDYGWTGKVIELRGDPVNDGVVLVEYSLSAEEAKQLDADEGYVVQRFHRALNLSPVMQLASPFRRASNWLTRVAQDRDSDFYDKNWRDTEGEVDLEPFVKNYGETDNYGSAGYILPDGRMLDFSEVSQGGTSGVRSLDHRDVGGGTEGMMEFMRRTGTVRFGHFGGDTATVDFFGRLTSQQARVISRIVPRLDYLVVDIRSSNGDVEFSQEAEGRIDVRRLWASVQGM